MAREDLITPMGPGFFIFFQEDTGSYGASPEGWSNDVRQVPDFTTSTASEIQSLAELVKEDISDKQIVVSPKVQQQITTAVQRIDVKALAKDKGMTTESIELFDDLEMLFWFLLLNEL